MHGHLNARFKTSYLSGSIWLNTQINILRCTDSKTSKFYMFRAVPLFIIRSFSLYTQQRYMAYMFADSCQQTCMTYAYKIYNKIISGIYLVFLFFSEQSLLTSELKMIPQKRCN